jgi:hypothetical protein
MCEVARSNEHILILDLCVYIYIYIFDIEQLRLFEEVHVAEMFRFVSERTSSLKWTKIFHNI